MLRYDRVQVGVKVCDSLRLCTPAAGECDEALRGAGFEAQCEQEHADDDDSILCPPSPAIVGGGGNVLQSISDRSLKVEITSYDEEARSRAGFSCMHDVMRRVFYGRPMVQTSPCHYLDAERSTKGAITALLDVAEAHGARKITLGLGTEHAGRAEFVCALLYLGFQVAPARRSPWIDNALLLDLDMGWDANNPYTGTGTGTSGCSTSDQADMTGLESMDSELDGALSDTFGA